VARAILRSRRCFHRVGSVSSWPPPPVGRGSWDSMQLAARHTAISPTRAGAQIPFRWCPDGLGFTLAGVVLDLVGEVGDELGSPCQVVAPDGMGMQRLWNARQPGQRTWVGRRQLGEAPVEDGGHVAGGPEVASIGGCLHVTEGVFAGFGCEGEQVGSQGWPGGFSGESRDIIVGLVELCDGLGSTPAPATCGSGPSRSTSRSSRTTSRPNQPRSPCMRRRRYRWCHWLPGRPLSTVPT
jgi:hypothetical protein